MGTSPSRHESSSATSRVGGNGHAVPVAASSATSGSNQAQSKRAPAPHKFHEIVAQEKTATAAELQDRKYWVHEKTKGNCFLLFPKALSITWCEDPWFWNWHPLWLSTDACSDDTEIEAVSLQNVCWLEIHGKLDLSHLTPGLTYEVFFDVMLTKEAYGWSVPVNLQLKFPSGGTVQERKENLQEKPRGQWLQLKAGEIEARQGQNGEMEISMFEYDVGLWKRGLVIKCIEIVPKE